MTYIVITFFVLLFLNIYCAKVSHQLFYGNNKVSMLEKCQLAADEIAQQDVLSDTGVREALSRLGSLSVTRTIVTDAYGFTVYDSLGTAEGTYALLPEVVQALDDATWQYGNDAFSWIYQDGNMRSSAAVPVIRYGTITGCVYMTNYDREQGQLLQSLQSTMLQITLILELIIIIFSLAFSKTFSRRLQRVMSSMRIIQEGDYSHKLEMGGSDEIALLGNEFDALTERLQISENKRRQFVSDASHELKTPLAVIMANTEIIASHPDDTVASQMKWIDNTLAETKRMATLVQDLLFLTKSDDGIKVEMANMDLSDCVQSCVLTNESLFYENNKFFDSQIEPNIHIDGNEGQIRQLVTILLDNANKYAIGSGNICLTLTAHNKVATLTVTNDSNEVTPEQVAHIFDRFYTLDTSRNKTKGGNGLGLSIAERIVHTHKGKITAEYKNGKMTFRAVLPVVRKHNTKSQ
jgi:signal transduction histidine kinase